MENKEDNTSVTDIELIADVVCRSIQLAYKQGKVNDNVIKSITITTRFSDGGLSKVDISVDP